ncbi:PLP-dependent aminotransferase family protein [Olivibacter sitiensis]|uniref:aminotransferase-like domain-containing protein n=1 Tax=Olivibacter sitiensis TaxID=376470 RepID=UPI000428A1B7|nr:PLP-dependent aminotransferase family protein [Olivibacter sitiensis]
MDSPVLVPYKSFIEIDRLSATPVYLQVAHQLINAIQRGYLTDGHKLPGTRQMGKLLGLHRNTVVASYAELEAQGWIENHPSRGAFVRGRKDDKPQKLKGHGGEVLATYPRKTGFSFRKWNVLDNPFDRSNARLLMDDGLPDVRLSHIDYLSRLYHTNMKRRINRAKLGYQNLSGSEYYRENLANFLNLTRGLHVASKNLLVTRSLELGVYIVAETLLDPGDLVVVGELSYFATNMIFQKAGATIMTVPLDAEGIDVSAVRRLCVERPFRMLYLTPHHHYPTTVTLSAERRVALLELSARYGFIILEDDYDYDIHYDGSPILPMASADTEGMVVYVGVFGKLLASGFRSGFIVAPEPLINEMGKLLDIMDRYGDTLTELALGELIADGEMHRYLKKSIPAYKARRDELARSLVTQLGNSVEVTMPSGGLAVWTSWPKETNLMQLQKRCAQRDLYLPRYLLYQSKTHCGIRLGFGSLTPEEGAEAVEIIKQATISLT